MVGGAGHGAGVAVAGVGDYERRRWVKAHVRHKLAHSAAQHGRWAVAAPHVGSARAVAYGRISPRATRRVGGAAGAGPYRGVGGDTPIAIEARGTPAVARHSIVEGACAAHKLRHADSELAIGDIHLARAAQHRVVPRVARRGAVVGVHRGAGEGYQCLALPPQHVARHAARHACRRHALLAAADDISEGPDGAAYVVPCVACGATFLR